MSLIVRHMTRRSLIGSALVTTAGIRLGIAPTLAQQQWQWTEDQTIANHITDASPALATLGDQLHMVHKGQNTTRLWHSWWTVDGGWSEDQEIPNHSSDAAPALAVVGDQLHLSHKGERTNALWHSWWTREWELVRGPGDPGSHQ